MHLNKYIILLIILIAAGAVYSNTLTAPFQWDDIYYISQNPIIKHEDGSYIPPGIQQAVKNRPVGYLTFSLNYRLHGLDTTGYHIFNISLHIINSMLIYTFCVLLLKIPQVAHAMPQARREGVAFFTSLIFAIHPMQTEAVTYVFQRHILLFTFFYLTTLILYLYTREHKHCRATLYALSIITAFLAMKSKETAFTLPIAVTFIEIIFPNEAAIKQKAVRLSPYYVVLLAMLFSISSSGGGPWRFMEDTVSYSRGYEYISRPEYLLTQFTVIMKYIRLLFWPSCQSIAHQVFTSNTLWEVRPIISLSIHLSIILSAFLLYRRSRIYAFGVIWFYLLLSVESTIIPLPMLMNEYRVYAASFGVFIAFFWLLFSIPKSRFAFLAFSLSCTAAVLLLSNAAYQRNGLYQSRTALWEDAADKSPLEAVVHFNLASAYMDAGNRNAALPHYRRTIELDPLFDKAFYSLGVLSKEVGMQDDAINYYIKALSINPEYPEALNNLGALFNETGKYDKAAAYLQKAVQYNPNYFNARYNLGIAYGALDMLDEAEYELLYAVRLMPSSGKAHLNLGVLYMKKQMPSKALIHLKRASELMHGDSAPQILINELQK